MAAQSSIGIQIPRPFGLPLIVGGAAVLGLALLSALLAFAVSVADWKIAAIVVMAVLVGLALVVVRQRQSFLLALTVLSLQVVFHKAIGPLDSAHSGGGPAGVYVTNIDLVVGGLYCLWLADGRLVSDLGKGLRRPALYLPLVGIGTFLPSIFAADSLTLFLGELVRLVVGYLLYAFVALRVRSRRDIVVILVTFALVAVAQFGLVAFQARSGSALGLVALGAGGTDSALAFRTIGDGSAIPRPSGTVLHAILLGSLMASVGAVSINLALHLTRWWLRLGSLLITGAALGGIALAMARAPILGLAVAFPISVGYALVVGRLRWQTFGLWCLVAFAACVAMWSKISQLIGDNVGTGHFWVEVDARLQLNGVALDMLNSSPLNGVGLNNAALLLDRFEPYGAIFPGFPAHNIYLLFASETGVIGLFGLILMLGAPLIPALRLARTHDRFLSAVGCGVAAMLVTMYVQEQLLMALRYDTTRMAFWLLAGLGVAGWRMAERKRRAAALETRPGA